MISLAGGNCYQLKHHFFGFRVHALHLIGCCFFPSFKKQFSPSVTSLWIWQDWILKNPRTEFPRDSRAANQRNVLLWDLNSLNPLLVLLSSKDVMSHSFISMHNCILMNSLLGEIRMSCGFWMSVFCVCVCEKFANVFFCIQFYFLCFCAKQQHSSGDSSVFFQYLLV